MEEYSNVIELTEKELFKIFADVDKTFNLFKSASYADYMNGVNRNLPSSCEISNENEQLNLCIRQYKRKKLKKLSSSQITELAGNNVVLSVLTEDLDHLTLDNGGSSGSAVASDDPDLFRHVAPIPVVSAEPPSFDKKPAPTSHKPEEFTIYFSKSYKDFDDLGDRQKKNITQPLVDMLTKFIEYNQFSITKSKLLGYLLTRENCTGNNTIKRIGNVIYKQEEKDTSFTPLEAVSFMHSMVLSKEQTRRVRHFLALKGIRFPTTDEMLPVRKSLRPETFPVLDGKGRSTSYKDLVNSTTSSIISIVEKNSVITEPNLKIYLKDGGDGAGQMPSLKSKKAVNDKQNMFQYGIIPLKMTKINANATEELVWSNPVPNSARSLRPVYLIRDKETNKNLLDEVIPTTDEARNDLNNNGTLIGGKLVQIDIKDSMKDLKFKKLCCGLGGAACILCKSKVEDWTNEQKIKEGFRIERSAADTREIFNSVVDENGNIVIKPSDFNERFGVM